MLQSLDLHIPPFGPVIIQGVSSRVLIYLQSWNTWKNLLNMPNRLGGSRIWICLAVSRASPCCNRHYTIFRADAVRKAGAVSFAKPTQASCCCPVKVQFSLPKLPWNHWYTGCRRRWMTQPLRSGWRFYWCTWRVAAWMAAPSSW